MLDWASGWYGLIASIVFTSPGLTIVTELQSPMLRVPDVTFGNNNHW